MLVVIAHYLVEPGAGDAVEEVLRRHAASSAAETGCLQFAVHRSLDDPDRFALYEVYVDEDAFVAHRSTPHFQQNVEQVIVPKLKERSWSRFALIEPDGRH